MVAWADELVDLGDRPGHARPGRKVATLVHAMVAGAECIDDCDVLRSGSTHRVLGHQVMARPPSARSSGPSPSDTSVSSTPSLSRCLPEHAEGMIDEFSPSGAEDRVPVPAKIVVLGLGPSDL